MLTGVVGQLLRPDAAGRVFATSSTIAGCAVLLSMPAGWLGATGFLGYMLYLGRF